MRSFHEMKATDILPDDVNTIERDGRTIRKGSVAAFIANAKLIEASDTPADLRARAEADLRELVQALVDASVFEVFEVRSPKIKALIGDIRSA